jgi:serine/threonine-protein kinase HipA
VTDVERVRAEVLLGDLRVGVLEQRQQRSRFEPAEAWADMPAGSRPVLGQQFEEDPFAAHGSRFGAPIWFEHLLPETGGPLRDAVSRALGVASTASFDLLVALGNDLPGAVRVVRPEGSGAVRTVARRERAAESPSSLTRVPLPLRVSLAGLQFKISAREGKRGIGLHAVGEDGDWILKFADQRFPTLAANEYVTMTWASLAGLAVPEIRLVPTAEVEGIADLVPVTSDWALGVKRYDRGAMGRIHQEDFAQVLGLPTGNAKYSDVNIDSILRILQAVSPDDTDEFFRRLVFVVLSGNDDAHAKNWSLWYPDRTTPRLSPAYDLVSTAQLLPSEDMSLKLAGARRFGQVNRERLRSLARRAGMSDAHTDEIVVAAVRAQVDAWQGARELTACDPALRDFIDHRLTALRLVSDCR